MALEDRRRRRTEAAEAFNLHLSRADGAAVAASLADGLDVVCDSFLTRVQFDVERIIGRDSMLMPVSAIQTEERTRREIELYTLVESAVEVRQNAYLAAQDDWYLRWLGRMRLGDDLDLPGAQQRLASYLPKVPDERRRGFSEVLERTMPEARRAPLIVYRLLPLAVSIATNVAFSDQARAAESRKRQNLLLPAISDCQQCHGHLLENGDRCAECGNPFWKYDWLTAT
jgi:hypothetical protein